MATRVIPPFVMREAGQFEGYSIDLWRSIEKELGVRSGYTAYPSVKALLEATKAGREDLGIAAISITAEREAVFDFSQPMFDSGLQILVRDQSGSGNAMPSFWQVLFSPTMLQLLGVVFLLIVIPAHLLWLVERHHEGGFVEHKSYIPGIFKTGWWAAGTLGAQADEMPKSWAGRIIALMWMFLSIVFVAYFTATITTAMTVQQLQGDIRGPEDLPGKKVATVAGSTSETYLREHKAKIRAFSQIEEAIDALEKKRVDAVVYDAPVLLYYAAQAGKGKVQPVGGIFRKENYGIVLPENSPWREPVNRALLTLKENGTLQALYDKWFTGDSTGSPH